MGCVIAFSNIQEFGDFQLGQQEDAHDFYKQVLQKMHEEMYREAVSKENLKITDPKERLHVENTTLIYQIFGGYLER